MEMQVRKTFIRLMESTVQQKTERNLSQLHLKTYVNHRAVCYFHLIEVMLHSRVHPCSESANRNIYLLLLLIIALNMENRKTNMSHFRLADLQVSQSWYCE